LSSGTPVSEARDVSSTAALQGGGMPGISLHRPQSNLSTSRTSSPASLPPPMPAAVPRGPTMAPPPQTLPPISSTGNLTRRGTFRRTLRSGTSRAYLRLGRGSGPGVFCHKDLDADMAAIERLARGDWHEGFPGLGRNFRPFE